MKNALAFWRTCRRGGTSMADDVVLNKASIIERCLRRVREEYADNPTNLHDDITKQDAIVLNLQRACQAAIDLSRHAKEP